jgi:FkbH-like protein
VRGAAGEAIARWRALQRATDPTVSPGRRILVAASFTAAPLGPALGVGVADLDDGRPPTIDLADYNQLFQVCLQPDQHGALGADEVIVLWRIEDVAERDFHAWASGDVAAGARVVDAARSLGAAVAHLAARRHGPVIAADAPVPIGFGLDHRDPALLTELADLQRSANDAFAAGLDTGGVPIERIRVAALQHAHGSLASFDRRNWVMYRQPFTADFAAEVGAAIAEVIGARTRVPPKVLVLDCDNTLWAGTIADDGIGGLNCSDAFPGFAYRSFQIAAQRLRRRGVLLALASKNDPGRVVEALDTLDGMVLSDDDIAARRISWDEKSAGIAEIAAELNLGLDSFVFVDDSDYELGAVRTLLPAVRTLRVPDDIEELPDLLAGSGWFRMLQVTDDDRLRTERMQAAADRTAVATTMTAEEFLSSLELRVRVFAVGAADVGRIAQLINKTNQFNLTTRRRSETEVRALLDDPDVQVLGAAVEDRFGEYGLVGVTVAAWDGARWDLDTVLMSCRVLGRGVETAILAATVDGARARRPGPVVGHYLDSGRNAMVAGLFTDHGFAAVTGHEGVFVLDAHDRVAVPAHIVLAT